MPSRPLVAALVAAGLALVAVPALVHQANQRQARRVEAQRREALEAAQRARPPAEAPSRSRQELRDALLRGPSLEDGKTASAEQGAPRPSTPATIDWRTLTDSCVRNLERGGPRIPLRVTGSTGFVPSSAEAADAVGVPWDQAIRLDLEPADGSPGKARVACYFQQGRLQGLRRL